MIVSFGVNRRNSAFSGQVAEAARQVSGSRRGARNDLSPGSKTDFNSELDVCEGEVGKSPVSAVPAPTRMFSFLVARRRGAFAPD